MSPAKELGVRPIRYAFDAVSAGRQPQKHSTFQFLANARISPLPEFENCNVVDPREDRIPWPCAFPASLQCKYWGVGEEAAYELLQEILRAKTSDEQGLLPEKLQFGTAAASRNLVELVDSVVTRSINIFPAANESRARIMAKLGLLSFMHDGVYSSTAVSDSLFQ
ncbi:hypothetical protein BO71DRAFT_396806 [Aspergillus ellipticus CBS 707.79]|uniref:Uncharacterized protein n=1 Tax=Aspergillus ellipticus CBS 707.79 TaxID=1448320 RepID=A0A319DH66_9EURO|nr:hypothetical protein BO71DRAFT_396806 [Aspergillus ellipticus CBS 707.79]